MTKENPFENWTYVPAESNEEYDFKKKIFNARGYCESIGKEFVREDLFKYHRKFLLVVEMEKDGIASLLTPGFIRRNKKTQRKNKIFPVPSFERGEILKYLNEDNIDAGREKMDGTFWNTEVGVKGGDISNKPPVLAR
jgi:hypothetical protein